MVEHGTPLKPGEKPQSSGGPDTKGEEQNRGSGSKPKKFNELAERLGVELSDLYALEIATSSDGKPVTVEMLKDHYAQRSDFAVERLQWEEERNRQNAELVRGNAQLRELLAAIPRDKLDAKVLEAVRTKVQESANRERARTLDVVPEWKDAETEKKERAAMGAWLEENFGFPRDYLATVYDHRALHMMRTAWRREERVKAALAEVSKEPPNPLGKSKPASTAPSRPSSGPRQKGRAGLMSLLEE